MYKKIFLLTPFLVFLCLNLQVLAQDQTTPDEFSDTTASEIQQEQPTTEAPATDPSMTTDQPAIEQPVTTEQTPNDLQTETTESQNENAETPSAGLPAKETEKIPGVEYEETKARISKRICKCRYATDTPYTDRRETWGGTIGVQWGAFSPVNYRAFNGNLYETYYGTTVMGDVELTLALKWNFALGSLAAQVGGGYFTASNSSHATLKIIPVTAGMVYAMDNIFKEPYVVPYVGGGLFTGFTDESIQVQAADGSWVQGSDVQGRSAFGLYYSAGLMFQLDWIDDDSHNSGYEDFGLENTFIYVEARSFLTTLTTNLGSDLTTPLQIFAGLKTEF